jgi:hypothetical protein
MTKKNPPNPKAIYGDKKPPIGEIPLAARVHGSLAHMLGRIKYGFRNWRETSVEAMTYVHAAERHLQLWAEGETWTRPPAHDPDEPRVHNLGAVIACCGILLDAEVNGTLIDNRSHSPESARMLEDAEKLVASINAWAAKREGSKS